MRFTYFLPQSAQRLSSSTRGFEFFTTEDAEVFSVNSVSSLRLLLFFTTEGTEAFVIYMEFWILYHRVHRVFFNPSGLFQLPEPHVFDVMGVRKHIYGLYFNQGVFFT